MIAVYESSDIHPISVKPFLIRVTGNAGAYHSNHWAKGRNTHYTGCAHQKAHTSTHTLVLEAM